MPHTAPVSGVARCTVSNKLQTAGFFPAFLLKDMVLKLRKFRSHHKNIALAVVLLVAVFLSFTAYVIAEKDIDRANDQRQQSLMLAHHLRLTSDELTRMVRSYVVTGEPRFKQYYQDILDIRNGTKPMPDGYLDIYWDRVLAHILPPPTERGAGIPLMEMMHQAGISSADLALLQTAKAASDALTAREFLAMEYIESEGINQQADRATARGLLHDDTYHQAKARIMQPINDFIVRIDWKTLVAVRHAENLALLFRSLFLLVGAYALLMLWRTYQNLHRTLGGSADEVCEHLHHIGQGELYTPIAVPAGMEGSVIASLAEMQSRLQQHDHERNEMEEKIRQMAFYDPLTHLANRRLLSDRLTQALALSRRSGQRGALMVLDLDNFKPLNDQHGHEAGDLLLIEVAQRLLSCTRAMDTVARMGGDEFVVLLSQLQTNPEAAQREAAQIAHKILEHLAQPYLLKCANQESAVLHRCTASIGVVVFYKDEVSDSLLFNRADAAMYQAKAAGRNTVRFNTENDG